LVWQLVFELLEYSKYMDLDSQNVDIN